MSTIRLQKTNQLAYILNKIRFDFPLLDDTEIIKMIISKYYTDRHIPTRQATPEEEIAIREGREAIKRGDYVTVRSDEELDLEKLIEQYG